MDDVTNATNVSRDTAGTDRAVVVGAGLVGSLLAVFLARRGLRVSVFERGRDLRNSEAGSGRSINLVASSRGIEALARVGLADAALEMTVPVHGRMMHALDGMLSYQPYGKDDAECNYSISRGELNRFLIDAAERAGADFTFERRLVAADFDSGRLTFHDSGGTAIEVDAPLVFGTDGAASAVRAALVEAGHVRDSMELLGHGYKELSIPVEQGRELELNALHIWPRGRTMLMALPNLDRSFTVTLYLPERGEASFVEVADETSALRLFEDLFPDAIPRIPNLEANYVANPTGVLGTVRCAPWHYRDRVLLLGDAAHAIVPFFGQGMNAGFEDCSVLDSLLDEHGTDWTRIFPSFDRARKTHTDAIADMALENFVEMSARVGDSKFLLRKAVEHRLEQAMPHEYRSRYSMVMYGSVPYRSALEAGQIQRQILGVLCEGIDDPQRVDVERARELIRDRLTPYLKSASVSLDY